jgi:putative phage-type endonuclease
MKNRKDWLKERKTYIGGSDIGAIIGCSSYKTALDVYMDKTSETLEELEGDAIYWGNALEDVVAEEYSKRVNLPVEVETKLLRHSKYPFIAANIDRWVDSGRYILECKTAGFMARKSWGDVPSSKQIPESYQCQVAYYAAITGVPKVDIAVLIGGQDFRIYTYHADQVFQEKLIRAAVMFWNKYVLTGIPPKATNLKDVENMHPKSNGLEIEASHEILDKVNELHDLKSQDKMLHKEIEALSFEIKEFMADNELLIDEGGQLKATWRNTAPKPKLDTEKLAKEHGCVYRECLKEGEGSRMFLVK